MNDEETLTGLGHDATAERVEVPPKELPNLIAMYDRDGNITLQDQRYPQAWIEADQASAVLLDETL
jgi:hypothetical protein